MTHREGLMALKIATKYYGKELSLWGGAGVFCQLDFRGCFRFWLVELILMVHVSGSESNSKKKNLRGKVAGVNATRIKLCH